jgi:hypothetical protein
MKSIILIITLLYLCPLNQAQQNISNQIDYSKFSNDSIGAYYGPKVGILTMKFILDSSGDILKYIRVYSGRKLIQNIYANKKIVSMDFTLDDYNFDGFKDISVVAFPGQHGDSYWMWIYSPKDLKFHYNKFLSNKMGLILDRRSKHIGIYCHMSAFEGGEDTYIFRHNKVILIRSEYHMEVQHNNTLWGVTNLKRWVGKKWVTTIDSTRYQ